MYHFLMRSMILFSLLVLVTACGGGGGGGDNTRITGPTYSGSESPAAVSASNAESVGTAGTDAASQTVNAETADSANPFGVSIEGAGTLPTPALTETVKDIAWKAIEQSQSSTMPVGATLTASQLNQQAGSNDFCGGSVTIPDNTDYSDISITFNNLCYNDTVNAQTVTLNGGLRIIDNGSTVTVIYSNFTMVSSSDGSTYTINATITCDTTGTTCSIDYKGSDGVTYRMADLSVSGSDSTGYWVSATFYHPDYGYVSLATDSALYYNCSGQRQPSAGKLSFTGASNTAGSIEFLDCANYQYCYDEDTTDGVGEICAAGTW